MKENVKTYSRTIAISSVIFSNLYTVYAVAELLGEEVAEPGTISKDIEDYANGATGKLCEVKDDSE